MMHRGLQGGGEKKKPIAPQEQGGGEGERRDGRVLGRWREEGASACPRRRNVPGQGSEAAGRRLRSPAPPSSLPGAGGA